MSDAAMAPGWYHGEGDPEGTKRYWDGGAWVGEPQMMDTVVGGAAAGGASVGGGAQAAATSNYGPLDWYKMPWTRYADFSGRSRRAEYWWFALGNFVIQLLLQFGLAAINEALGLLVFVFALAALVPSIAVTIRRLHDTNRSGWWWFIVLIPLIGSIVLLVFMFSDSKREPNKWGVSPKYG